MYVVYVIFGQFQSLSDNAILGITVGICLAFPVLVLSTQNIIVGFLATLSICCVTVCVIGVIPLAGWSLGVGGRVMLADYNIVGFFKFWREIIKILFHHRETMAFIPLNNVNNNVTYK